MSNVSSEIMVRYGLSSFFTQHDLELLSFLGRGRVVLESIAEHFNVKPQTIERKFRQFKFEGVVGRENRRDTVMYYLYIYQNDWSKTENGVEVEENFSKSKTIDGTSSYDKYELKPSNREIRLLDTLTQDYFLSVSRIANLMDVSVSTVNRILSYSYVKERVIFEKGPVGTKYVKLSSKYKHKTFDPGVEKIVKDVIKESEDSGLIVDDSFHTDVLHKDEDDLKFLDDYSNRCCANYEYEENKDDVDDVGDEYLTNISSNTLFPIVNINNSSLIEESIINLNTIIGRDMREYYFYCSHRLSDFILWKGDVYKYDNDVNVFIYEEDLDVNDYEIIEF